MGYLTTKQAAERLHITPTRVRKLITDGRLSAERFGRAHSIPESALAAVAVRPPGRPRKVRQKD